jgi:hypothetical protein
MICWQETSVTIKKKDILPSFVSMNALLFSMHAPTRNHSKSWKIIDNPHQSCPYKKILFSRYFISKSLEGSQLHQLINQRSKTNIYIIARTVRTAYDRR